MSKYHTYTEIAIEVDYDYQPEEKAVLYPNDKAYPGCPAEVTIYGIDFGGIDILEYTPDFDLEIIKAEIMEMENTPPEER